MDRFRLGFIGAGFVARFHALALRAVRNVDLAGVYALANAEQLASYAREMGVGPCDIFPSISELCRNCDAVAILVPNDMRVDVAEAVVSAVKEGAPLKGLLCEKPLARTVAEAERMVELARASGLPTAYLENQVHMKPIRAALTQLHVQETTMGPLYLARSAEEHGGPHEAWFWDPVRQGGGALSDMACHSIALAWQVLTPSGRPHAFLRPVSVQAETALLKWGRKRFREELLERTRVDYAKTPAEDFATGLITFENPETRERVKAQFTNSWMFDKQGLRVQVEALGPGYAFELNTLRSPLEIFVGDVAAEKVADAESALEKSTATRGLLAVHHNEADLYGYVDELIDACAAFREGRDALLNWDFGLEVTKLVQAAYMAAERRQTLDLTDEAVQKQLGGYTSLIAQGRGAEILFD
jgi:predicted dehydrogenase